METLKTQSITDSLTGTPNRRHVHDVMHREHARVERYGTPLSVIIMDLDRFKAINDRFGHPVGDRVLVTFSQRVRSSVRETDVVARWGGEEFIVVSPGCSLAKACSWRRSCDTSPRTHRIRR